MRSLIICAQRFKMRAAASSALNPRLWIFEMRLRFASECVRSRLVRHIRRQTFCGRQARPLADQQQHNPRPEQLANLIHNSHAAMMNDERLADAPASRLRTCDEQRQQPRNLRADRRDR